MRDCAAPFKTARHKTDFSPTPSLAEIVCLTTRKTRDCAKRTRPARMKTGFRRTRSPAGTACPVSPKGRGRAKPSGLLDGKSGSDESIHLRGLLARFHGGRGVVPSDSVLRGARPNSNKRLHLRRMPSQPWKNKRALRSSGESIAGEPDDLRRHFRRRLGGFVGGARGGERGLFGDRHQRHILPGGDGFGVAVPGFVQSCSFVQLGGSSGAGPVALRGGVRGRQGGGGEVFGVRA